MARPNTPGASSSSSLRDKEAQADGRSGQRNLAPDQDVAAGLVQQPAAADGGGRQQGRQVADQILAIVELKNLTKGTHANALAPV